MSASLPREGEGNSAHNSGLGSRQRIISRGLEDEWQDEEDDDDMEMEDEDEPDDSGQYHGAEEYLRAAFPLDEEEDEEGDSDGEAVASGSRESRAGRLATSPMTRRQLLHLLGQVGIFAEQLGSYSLHTRIRRHQDSDEDGEDEEPEGGYGGIGKRRRARDRYPSIPSDAGRALMSSGTFGDNELYEDGHERKGIGMSSRIFMRELGFYTGVREQIQSRLMAQDFKIRLYDTSNPYRWKYYRTVEYPYGQWTITDASLSPDNKLLAYSSIQCVVCLAPTDPDEAGEPWLLDFSISGLGGTGRSGFGARTGFGIWSIRFSGDGRELAAGASDQSIYIYDLETRQSTLRIRGHDDDVNAVCFGDKTSPHILFSGSDDTTLKVWDRRSMGDSRAAGVFLGHTEGLTYVDSKGDGRYVLSNGKDQTMKLWDIRKMVSMEHFSTIDPAKYSSGFDYRHPPFEEDEYKPHPHDCSLVTFRGHKVLKTLIRCHFSPPTSSNSRYVYTGSFDGKVYIYNLDATVAGVVDVKKGTHNSRPRDPELLTNFYAVQYGSTGAWRTCVRDASWHPSAPIIAATSWNGWGMATGTCTTHVWNDGVDEDEAGPKAGTRVNERLEYDESLYSVPRRVGRTRVRTRSLLDDEDD
ncbi:hypothetical protein FGG08_004599 [Glutinoglossum americanum]|uniref:WD40 repeat-like protein n=1 Tax=Glutinoglossum americanum TaxID=1670608 RepID=A0A9P8I763_9PEZI|nr:hypothetical protein FGG08_004599 [Glutinoglossum americanum]